MEPVQFCSGEIAPSVYNNSVVLKSYLRFLIVVCLALPLGMAAALGNQPQQDVYVYLPSIVRPYPTTPVIPTATITPIPTAISSPTPENTPVVPTAVVTVWPTETATIAPSPTSPEPTRDPARCAAEYPTVCIAPPPPNLNCDDILDRNFVVLPPDRHRFDGDHDGIGCEAAGQSKVYSL